MKAYIGVLAALFMVITNPELLTAQNTFPATGNAGIGTTTPFANLEIKANQANALMLDPFGSGAGKTSELRFRELSANGSNYLGFKAPDNISGNLIWVLPSADGSNGQFLSTDGEGNLSWKASPSDANKTLSNLSSPTKVNQSLIPDAGGGKDLGSSARPWSSLYISENISTGSERIFSLLGNSNTFIGASSGISNSGSNNTFAGESSGMKNTTGNANTALGSFSLYGSVTGSYNTVNGTNSMYSNVAGSSNVATGYATLYNNVNGYNNLAQGYESMYSNTTGFENSASGISTLFSNTTGYYNAAMGSYALYANLSGFSNSALGFQSLYNNTGSSNTAAGCQSLYSNAGGSNNTANGHQSLYTNTTGQSNVATGYQALFSSNGSSNTATGYQALYENTGSQNTATGLQALYANTSGNYNTADGYSAGSYNDNSSYCTFLGYDADQASTSDYSNSTAIGWTCRLTASDQVRVGNSTITSIGGYANWTNVSDGRFKKEVQENVPGLAFINKLKPVTYHLDIAGIRKFTGEDRSDAGSNEANGSAEALMVNQAIKEKESVVYSGFVAQQVESAAREVGYDFSGIDAPKNQEELYGLRYSEFVVPLVKAVQELSTLDTQRKEEIKNLTAEIETLKTEIEEIQNGNSASRSGGEDFQAKQSAEVTSGNEGVFLGQNFPNPFDQSTIIPVRLTQHCTTAYITISFAATGKVVAVLPVSDGQTFVTVEPGSLTAGAYLYSLYVDENLISTKSMMVTR